MRLVYLFPTLLLIATPAANATMIPFEFSGVIDTVNDPHGLLPVVIQPGDTFSGSYLFDSATPDSNPGDPTVGLYQSVGPSVSARVGALQVSTGTDTVNTMQVVDRVVRDTFLLRSENFESAGLQIDELSMSLWDSTATAFASDSFPLPPPDISAFSERYFLFDAYVDHPDISVYILGTVTFLTPEPSACALLALGGACSWRVRRNRRNRSAGIG